MKNITNYYVNNKNNLISDKDSYIIGKKFRFTILSPRLIRLEYNDKGIFEDRATSLVILGTDGWHVLSSSCWRKVARPSPARP